MLCFLLHTLEFCVFFALAVFIARIIAPLPPLDLLISNLPQTPQASTSRDTFDLLTAIHVRQ